MDLFVSISCFSIDYWPIMKVALGLRGKTPHHSPPNPIIKRLFATNPIPNEQPKQNPTENIDNYRYNFNNSPFIPKEPLLSRLRPIHDGRSLKHLTMAMQELIHQRDGQGAIDLFEKRKQNLPKDRVSTKRENRFLIRDCPYHISLSLLSGEESFQF